MNELSGSRDGEKRRSDQVLGNNSKNTKPRIDFATRPFQLYEQQQDKGKELADERGQIKERTVDMQSKSVEKQIVSDMDVYSYGTGYHDPIYRENMEEQLSKGHKEVLAIQQVEGAQRLQDTDLTHRGDVSGDNNTKAENRELYEIQQMISNLEEVPLIDNTNSEARLREFSVSSFGSDPAGEGHLRDMDTVQQTHHDLEKLPLPQNQAMDHLKDEVGDNKIMHFLTPKEYKNYINGIKKDNRSPQEQLAVEMFDKIMFGKQLFYQRKHIARELNKIRREQRYKEFMVMNQAREHGPLNNCINSSKRCFRSSILITKPFRIFSVKNPKPSVSSWISMVEALMIKSGRI